MVLVRVLTLLAMVEEIILVFREGNSLSGFGQNSSGPSSGHYSGGYSNNAGRSGQFPGSFFHKGQNHGGHFSGGRGFWENNSGNNNGPWCQLYTRIGHVDVNCYYRFDLNFQGPSQFQNHP